jgi:hypothetical protein
MSERTDRSMQGNRQLLVTVIIIAAIVAAGGIIFWLWMPSTDADRRSATPDQANTQQLPLDEPLPITIYYPVNGMLESGSAAVTRQPDAQSQARESLAALLTGQRDKPAPVLRDIRMRAFYLDASGTAYIDLAPGPQKHIRASAWDEQLAVYAIVNTLMQNVYEIKQVRILINGREAQTLAGHIDLSRLFTKRMDLVKQ